MANINKQKIALHFTGMFEREGTVTARTLGHALSHLQRMVDKAVMFNKKQSIKKGDALPAVWYPEADLEVKEFEKGCVTIPLVGSLNSEIFALLRGVLHDPYQEAISDEEIEKKTIVDNYPHALNRAINKIELQTHDQVLANKQEVAQRYFAEGIYKDFDNLISPLRSAKATSSDSIAIEFINDGDAKEFEFNKDTSRRFHKLVSMKQLGPVIQYTGRLKGLVETKSKTFPYKGIFWSTASKSDHTLLITNEEAVNSLRMYNAAKKLTLTIIAAPIVAWGAYDQQKGDIVFLKITE